MITTTQEIHAVHAFTGEKLHITDVQRVSFKGGGCTTKYHVTGQATTPEGETYGISLIERGRGNTHIAALKALREAGLPVPPDAYFRPIGITALVTDLKEHAPGSELYGKAMLISLLLAKERGPYRRRPEIDPIFLSLTTPKRLEALGKTAADLADLATEHGISLPGDETFEFHVKPDGTGSLVFVDVDETNGHPCDKNGNRERAKDRFVAHAKEIRDVLLNAPRD